MTDRDDRLAASGDRLAQRLRVGARREPLVDLGGEVRGARRSARPSRVLAAAGSRRPRRAAPPRAARRASARAPGPPGSAGAARRARRARPRRDGRGRRARALAVVGLRRSPRTATISTSSCAMCCSITRSTPAASYSRSGATTCVDGAGDRAAYRSLRRRWAASRGARAPRPRRGRRRSRSSSRSAAARGRPRERPRRAIRRRSRASSTVGQTVLYSSANRDGGANGARLRAAADDDRRARLLQRLRPDRPARRPVPDDLGELPVELVQPLARR